MNTSHVFHRVPDVWQVEELKKLADLYRCGALSAVEFEAAKTRARIGFHGILWGHFDGKCRVMCRSEGTQ